VSKVFLPLREVKPGMRIAETILNDYGSIVISEGTILDDHMIKKLFNLNYSKVRVVEKENNFSSSEISESFNTSYNASVNCFKSVLYDAAVGKNLNMDKVDKVVTSVVARLDEKRDIVRCINQIKSADQYTYTHSINVSLLCMLLGKWMGFSKDKLLMLVQAGLLHDIGKSKVPKEILNKPSKLTPDEYEEIKKHTVYGYRMLEKEPEIDREIRIAVLMHHEREDGSGYPTGAKGDKISMMAKVIAVADIYDAMTSNRVYREKESPFEVFHIMEEEYVGKLDVAVVNAFLSNIAAYYIGDFAKLNTGEVCEIVHINPRHVSRPIIRVDDKYIDLTVEKELKIQEIL
jgi:putative nucleotidyltransferase with HDIG domain